MTPMKFALAASAAGLALTATPASAELLQFELTGGRNLTFQLDSNPTPDGGNTLGGQQATFRNVAGTLNGNATTFSVISFGTGVYADFSATAPGLGFTQYAFGGPIFSGTGEMPVFAPGTFNLSGSILTPASTLTISQVAGAVPEPGTWALLILGFGAVGVAIRRRRTTLAYA